MSFLKDFNQTSTEEMLKILSGKIEFFPAMKIKGRNSIKAPNLNAKSKIFESKNITFKIGVPAETEYEIRSMMSNINSSSGAEES